MLGAGTVSTSSTGTQILTIASGLTLPSGAYWLVAQPQALGSASPSLTCLSAGGEVSYLDIGANTANGLLGTAPPAGILASGYSSTGTLPSSFPGTPTVLTTATAPLVALQLKNIA